MLIFVIVGLKLFYFAFSVKNVVIIISFIEPRYHLLFSKLFETDFDVQ